MVKKDFSAYRGGTPKEEVTEAPQEVTKAAPSRKKARYGAYKTNTKKKLAALGIAFGLVAGGWYLHSEMNAPRVTGPAHTDTTEHTNFFADSATLLKRTQAVTANTTFFDSHFLRSGDGKPATTLAELQTLAHGLNRDDAFTTFKTSFDRIYSNPSFGGTGALSALPLDEQLGLGTQLRTAIETFNTDISGGLETDATKKRDALQKYQQQLIPLVNATLLFRGLTPTANNYRIAGGDVSGEVAKTEHLESTGATPPVRNTTSTPVLRP